MIRVYPKQELEQFQSNALRLELVEEAKETNVTTKT